MRMTEPFAGYGAENYRKAFEPSSDSFMINGPYEKTYDKVFAPQEIKDNSMNFKIGASAIIFIAIAYYLFLRKG